jgi:hypothetical protein
MIRLHAADRDQRVRVRSNGVGDDVFELPQLVAAERKAGVAVLALVYSSIWRPRCALNRDSLSIGVGPKVSG